VFLVLSAKRYARTRERWVKKGGVTQRFPSSEHLKDRGVPIPGVFQVCEHEGVSSSSRYVFLKKTIADLLQTDHSLHEHSDSRGW